MRRLVQCYIEGAADAWEAACTDFDLYVTGCTLEETKALLTNAIESYVADALREQEPTRARLLNRRSPWTVRLAWALRVATSRGARRREPRFEGRFTLPCPA